MKHLLISARNEILQLQRQNELLAAKVSVIEVFSAALLGPRVQGAMHPNIVYDLEREIAKLDAAKEQP